MRVSGPISHRCPFKDERDHGTVEVVWNTNGKTYELHSLGDYFAGFAESLLSHEEVTDRIGADLSVVAQIDLVSVSTTWHTAGMEVRCSTSPTLAEVTQ
jgi:NADPH-dependent 7-cyano-7-deazaguanine reductase QueF